MAARLDELAKRELKIPLDSFFWVDSTAVLYCIRNITKRFPVFVANRLATIESLSNVNQWNYVPSKLNPADIASRGLKAQKLKTSEWLQGPTFLLRSQSMWPSFKINIERPSIEFIPAKSQSVQSVIATEKAIDTTNQLINHCSSFDRFISLLQHKVRGKPFPLFKPLSVAELHIAERTLITHTQHEHFPGCFVSNKSLPRYLKKLQPIVIDGVLRVVGRLSHSLFDLSNPNLPPGFFSSEDCYSRRRWAQIQFLANQFWRRWMNEFMPNLLQRQKWFQQRKKFLC